MSVEPAESPFPASDVVAIARQPIHDRWQRVIGYELLFRGTGGLGADDAGGDDEERATARVIVETLTGVGLAAVVGRRSAHVRVTRRFLLDAHASALPADRVVLELPPPDPADDALRTVLERLADDGYRLSLACDPRAAVPPRAIVRLADSVKLDVGAVSPDALTDAAGRFAGAAGALIAAGVHTPALARRCRELGFDAIQGFHYCTPDDVHAHPLPTTRLSELRSLAQLYSQTISFEQFEQVIVRDPGLSHRLLAYLNSAFFNLPRHVSSVHEALTMLGMRAVRRWAALISLAGADAKPNELTVTALLRGRLCELIGRRRPAPTAGADAFFTVGLFSVMDAMMDAPLERVLDALPLTDEVRVALLRRSGPMGEALAAVVAYERGDVATAERLLPGLPLGELYVSALRWADAACGALDGDGARGDGDGGAPAGDAAQESDGEDGADEAPPSSTPA